MLGFDILNSRFVDDAFGFALTWNYWFNDAVAMASDLVALQLVLQYWTTAMPGWALSLIFWVLLILANIVTFKIYGEVCFNTFAAILANTDDKLEYWLSLLKLITIIASAHSRCGLYRSLIWPDIYNPRYCSQLWGEHGSPLHWWP